VLHEAFEAHLDRISTLGTVVLSVPLPAQHTFRPGIRRVKDPDAIVRLVEKSNWNDAALLLLSTGIREPEFRDWPTSWQHRWRKMHPSIFPAGAKKKEFLHGMYRAVSRRYSEFHHALFEHVLSHAGR